MSAGALPHVSLTSPAWRACLSEASSVDELRAGIASYHGGLDAERLISVAVFGAAAEGCRLVERCKALGIAVKALVDDNPAELGEKFAGAIVEPSDHRLATLDRATPIVIASHRVLSATQRLRALGFERVLPFAVLQTLRPDLFQPHMFYDGWLDDLLQHRERVEWLDAELADARSRHVLGAVLQYR